MTARPVREVVKFGLAAMDDNPADFTEYLCTTEAEQAKTVGVPVTTCRRQLRTMRDDDPWTGGWTWGSGQRC